MPFTEYDVLSARTKSELSLLMSKKLKEGWELHGGLTVLNPELGGGNAYTQAIVRSGTYTPPSQEDANGSEPDYYFVIALAGQSNGMAYGEGLPLPDTYDRPDPRIKQLARRATVTPIGKACKYNEIIPADHCLHDVQDMSEFNHPKATQAQYGCVGQGLHIAKKLLPFIPKNAGILLVPCCRGGSAFTAGTDGAFYEVSGATKESTLWGADKPLYKDLMTRTKAALKANPKNILLCVVWMQGEFDLKNKESYSAQPAGFDALVAKYRKDLVDVSAQCTGGSPDEVPWICGDTTYYWKETYPTEYDVVYGAYKNKEDNNVFFVPFMTDENGVNVGTNEPSEDPDIPAIGYYGSGLRTDSTTWTTADRKTHFGSWARRGIISDRLATAILLHAGRTATFTSGKVVLVTDGEEREDHTEENPAAPEEQASSSQEEDHEDVETTVTAKSVFSYDANSDTADIQTNGWTLTNVNQSLVVDGSEKALRLEKAEPSKSWSISHSIDADLGKSLFEKGGEISLRFKIPEGESLNTQANQYALGLYWRGNGYPNDKDAETYVASVILQTNKSNLELLHHKGAQEIVRIAGYGPFNNNWHTLTLRFPGSDSVNVIPVVDNVEGKAFAMTKWTNDAFQNDTIGMTDVTGNATTYPVLIDTLTVSVNEAEA
ncbi:TPA: DUF1737 domain-containing protein [Escherichia coli]|nr:DUF1737 domain-containing protein [Escherichia coli]HBN7236980.1 DUF1737 domain-containing protein [Escherichia coli]HBQ4880549.1 DUF1737 domain-containing protein [Escherichia coli]HDW3968195.1 DUF1737 domain-containing protein [Escherichia coli]